MNDRQKDLIKKFLYHLKYYSIREIFKRPAEHRLLIVMFHNVVEDSQQRSHWFSGNTANETQLEAALIALQRHYRVISVEDAVREMQTHGKLKEKSAAITFDDGYRSTYELVFPRLRKHGLPATVYVPTDWIDGKLNPWWIALIGMIDRIKIESDLFSRVGEVIGEAVVADSHIIGDPSLARQLLREKIEWNLMHRDDVTRVRVMQELRETLTLVGEPRPLIEEPMTWAQIKEMAAYGIEFGAHTLSHPNLSHIDLETAEREIAESKRVLESHIGTEVNGFAYPYGYDVNGYKRLRPMLEKYSFNYACTSWCGYVDSATDRYLLGRVGLPLSASTAVIARTLSVEYTS